MGTTRTTIIAVLFALLTSACGGGKESGDQAQKWLVGYSQCNRGEPWRQQMDTDIKANVEKHPELELIMKDAQNEAFQQIAHVKEFITQDVDLLIISPKDVSLTAAVAEAFDAEIPVIVPFKKALEGTDIEIVYEADMEWLSEKAREKMLAALQLNPDAGSIDLVYGANDPAAIAAYNAAKDLGREGEMIFVGVDALPHEGLEAVKNGILDATFEYPNGATIAIETGLKVLKGEKVEKQIVLGTRLYTPDNLASGGEPR